MHSTKSSIGFHFLLICAITLTDCYPRYPPSEYMDLHLDEEQQQSPQLIPLVPVINPNQYMVASVPAQPQPEQKFFILPLNKKSKKPSSSDEDDDHDSEQDSDDSDADSETPLHEFMSSDRPHKKTRTRCTKKVLFGDEPRHPRPQRPQRPSPHHSPDWESLSHSPPKHFDVHVGRPLTNSKGRVKKYRKGYRIDFVENSDENVADQDSDRHHY